MIGPVFRLEWMRTRHPRFARTSSVGSSGIWLGVVAAALVFRFICDTGPEPKAACWPHFRRVSRSRSAGIPGYWFSDSSSSLCSTALVAGAITEEKTRHTLEHLLTTQISPLALIVGKLLARMVDVVVLTLVVLPMAAFVGPYAGPTMPFLLGQMAVTILTAFGLSSLSVSWLRCGHERATALVVVCWSSRPPAWCIGRLAHLAGMDASA